MSRSFGNQEVFRDGAIDQMLPVDAATAYKPDMHDDSLFCTPFAEGRGSTVHAATFPTQEAPFSKLWSEGSRAVFNELDGCCAMNVDDDDDEDDENDSDEPEHNPAQFSMIDSSPSTPFIELKQFVLTKDARGFGEYCLKHIAELPVWTSSLSTAAESIDNQVALALRAFGELLRFQATLTSGDANADTDRLCLGSCTYPKCDVQSIITWLRAFIQCKIVPQLPHYTMFAFSTWSIWVDILISNKEAQSKECLDFVVSLPMNDELTRVCKLIHSMASPPTSALLSPKAQRFTHPFWKSLATLFQALNSHTSIAEEQLSTTIHEFATFLQPIEVKPRFVAWMKKLPFTQAARNAFIVHLNTNKVGTIKTRSQLKIDGKENEYQPMELVQKIKKKTIVQTPKTPTPAIISPPSPSHSPSLSLSPALHPFVQSEVKVSSPNPVSHPLPSSSSSSFVGQDVIKPTMLPLQPVLQIFKPHLNAVELKMNTTCPICATTVDFAGKQLSIKSAKTAHTYQVSDNIVCYVCVPARAYHIECLRGTPNFIEDYQKSLPSACDAYQLTQPSKTSLKRSRTIVISVPPPQVAVPCPCPQHKCYRSQFAPNQEMFTHLLPFLSKLAANKENLPSLVCLSESAFQPQQSIARNIQEACIMHGLALQSCCGSAATFGQRFTSSGEKVPEGLFTRCLLPFEAPRLPAVSRCAKCFSQFHNHCVLATGRLSPSIDFNTYFFCSSCLGNKIVDAPCSVTGCEVITNSTGRKDTARSCNTCGVRVCGTCPASYHKDVCFNPECIARGKDYVETRLLKEVSMRIRSQFCIACKDIIPNITTAVTQFVYDHDTGCMGHRCSKCLSTR